MRPSLTPDALAGIEKVLREERASIVESVTLLEKDDETLVAARATGETRPRSDTEGDSVAVERHLVAQLGAHAQSSLAEIDAALARIADGNYGLCSSCGNEIPAERLEVRPRTVVCVPCASKRR